MLARISRMEDKSSLSRFWLPGAFGSLAATPTVPGWAYTTCGCVGPRDHLHVSEPGDFKERTIGTRQIVTVASLAAQGNAAPQSRTKTDGASPGSKLTFQTDHSPLRGGRSAAFAAAIRIEK